MTELYSRDESTLAEGWDRIAERMELYPQFYEFVADVVRIVSLPTNATIADIGCGTGRLLALLAERGYSNLTGVDFSKRAIELAQVRVPTAKLIRHDIVIGPLPYTYDAIFVTEVIEHLTDPRRALLHLYHSLAEDGYLFLSFPNRLAFWPWYHLRGLRHLVSWWPRMQYWIMWFTMPYEMRSDQPLDHSYTPRQVAEFITAAGFHILCRRGMRLLPMFRIPGLDFTEAVVARLERIMQMLPPQWWYYRYMFVCQRPV